MRADEAMQIATADLIKTDAVGGLVTIYRSQSSSRSGWDYHLRFVPRDAKGTLIMQGTVVIGTYPSLQDAISIAHEKYVIKGQDWNPQAQVELFEDNRGALQIEARSQKNKADERTGS